MYRQTPRSTRTDTLFPSRPLFRSAGFIGRSLVGALAEAGEAVVALDIRPVAPDRRRDGVTYETGDICDPALVALFGRHRPRCVVHLASVVAAGGDPQRDHAIDVGGPYNVLQACRAAGVAHLVVTSSGAAYGYQIGRAHV